MAQKEITEALILADICRALESANIFFFRCNNIPVKGRSLGRWVPRGLPDIIICNKGSFIALEVKRPDGFYKGRNRISILRPEQQQWCDKLFDNGGYYYLVTSVDDVRNKTGIIPF